MDMKGKADTRGAQMKTMKEPSRRQHEGRESYNCPVETKILKIKQGEDWVRPPSRRLKHVGGRPVSQEVAEILTSQKL